MSRPARAATTSRPSTARGAHVLRWLAVASLAPVLALTPARAQDAAGEAATLQDAAPNATGNGDAAAPAAPTQSPPVLAHAGQIIVSSGLIRGFRGNTLLVRATTLSGAVGARLCVEIPDDAYALPELALREMPADQDWCGPETPVAEFPPGDAYVSARVVRPGAREPLASVVTTVTVNGDTHVALDGARLSFREHKHPARPLH